MYVGRTRQEGGRGGESIDEKMQVDVDMRVFCRRVIEIFNLQTLRLITA